MDVDLDAGNLREDLKDCYRDPIHFEQPRVDEYASMVDEVIDEETDILTYRGIWTLAGEFTDGIEEVINEEEPDFEDLDVYLRSEMGAFGAALGAMMEELGVPEEDLTGEYRLGGTMPMSIAIRSGVWNDAIDTGMYTMDYGEVDYTLRKAMHVGWTANEQD